MGSGLKKRGYHYTEVQFRVEGKARYGWSKYGGPREGLVKETLDEWYCQVCGSQQVKELPAYMFEINPKEFIRICSVCQSRIEEDDTFESLRDRVWDIVKR